VAKLLGSLALAVLLAATAVAGEPLPGAADESGPPPADPASFTIKIQLGGHALWGESGILPSGANDASEDRTGLVASLSWLGPRRNRFAWGFNFALEGNRLEIGPAVPQAGNQVFGIATIRLAAAGEYRFIPRGAAMLPGTTPYAWFYAGWNVNSVGVKNEWPNGGAAEGVPEDLDLSGSPALGGGFGLYQRITSAGLALTFEAGLQWNAGDFTMHVARAPDASGRYDLSGYLLLVGVMFGM